MNTLRASLACQTNRTLHMREFNPIQAKRELGLDGEWDEFIAAMENLTAIGPLEDTFVEEFYKTNLFTDAEREHSYYSEAGANRLVGRLMEVYHEGPGAELDTAKQTMYGVVNAVTHYYDFKTKNRSRDNRLNGAWFGRASDKKDRILQAAVDYQQANA
jgi:hypothetical protein